MLCRLCNTEQGKLCKAHLIPESFYRFMYPDNKVEGDALRMVLQDKDYLTKSRVGVYDDTILCANCDAILGQYDKYGKEVLLEYTQHCVYSHDRTEIFVWDNDIDVYKLSIFFLSVLWRCSISTRPELVNVSIGKKFENKIRELLLQSHNNIEEFPIIITRYNYLNENYKKVLYLPTPYKIESLNYYHIYFSNGYKVLIKVDSRPQHLKLEALTVKINSLGNVN